MPAYDAFVSYSHAEDRDVARRLHTGVEKFAKPWYRVRGLRLFLDENSLSANPGLWSAIESALADSAWFVLVTSPRAADSRWVDREIRWWLQHRSAERLLIVLADGELSWDREAGDFDAEASTALPQALLGALEEEPLWVTVPAGATEELELREAIVDVATAVRGVSKEELVSTAAREHRRTMRWARGAIAGLVLLLTAALVAGAIALAQRGTAIDQARLAQSRQIASVSQSTAATDLDAAMLLAVQAYREDANPQTRAALFSAATESPHLVRFLDAGGRIEKLVASNDGRSIVAGLVDGRVLRWPAGKGEPTQLFDFPRRISSLAISNDGSVVVAADRTRALLWHGGGLAPRRLPVPLGQHADVVALSPSGRTVAYHAMPMAAGARESITVAPVAEIGGGAVHSGIWPGLVHGALVLSSDHRLLVFGTTHWERRGLSGWTRLSGSKVSFGMRQGHLAVSADGRSFTADNQVSQVPVWPLAGRTDTLESDRIVDVPLTGITSLALSPDGGRLGVAGAGGLYVGPVPESDPSERSPERLGEPVDLSQRSFELPGQEADLLAFAGDETHLVSAAANMVGVWDLNQLDRLARVSSVPLQPGCTLCPGPQVAVSPDGGRLAVVDGFGVEGFIQSLKEMGGENRRPLPESEYGFGPLLWQGQGEFAVIILNSYEGGDASTRDPVSAGVRMLRAPESSQVFTAKMAADGDTVISVDGDGNVFWQDAETGELRDVSRAPPPKNFAEEEEVLEAAAIGVSPELLATVEDGVVTVSELPGRAELARIDEGPVAALVFAGDRLLVLHRDGSLQVWNARGTRPLRTLAGEEPPDDPQLVATSDGTIVAHRLRDNTIELDDLDTGAKLAVFASLGKSSLIRTGVAFSPDGSSLVTLSEGLNGSETGELIRREISPESLIRSACEAAGRDLTAGEWRAFVGAGPPTDLGCR